MYVKKIKNALIIKASVIKNKITPYDSLILKFFRNKKINFDIPVSLFSTFPLIDCTIGKSNIIPKPSVRPAIVVRKKDK